MEKTKNYDLKKPGQDDFYNVQDFDDNMEIIDEHMGKIENPVYDDAEELETLESGEKIGTAFGKIKLAISALVSHIFNFNNPHKVTLSQLGGAAAESLASHVQNKSNPHSVTKTQVGLGNCDNTADKDKSVKFASTAFQAQTIESLGHATGVPDQKLRFGRDAVGFYCSLDNVVGGVIESGHFIFTKKNCANRIYFSWTGSALALYVDNTFIGYVTTHT